MILYSVRVEFRTRENVDAQLLDALATYHPATGRSERGWVEAYLTVPAEDFVQLAQTTIAVTSRVLAAPVLAIELMPQDERDARTGIEPMPDLVSVTEAADLLSVTRQAVQQRIDAGTLPAQRIGNSWAIPRSAVERYERVDEAKDWLLARFPDYAVTIEQRLCSTCHDVHQIVVGSRTSGEGPLHPKEVNVCTRTMHLVTGYVTPETA